MTNRRALRGLPWNAPPLLLTTIRRILHGLMRGFAFSPLPISPIHIIGGAFINDTAQSTVPLMRSRAILRSSTKACNTLCDILSPVYVEALRPYLSCVVLAKQK